MRCHGEGCVHSAGAGGVCDGCWTRRHVLLRDLPDLWARLHGELQKGSQGLSERVSGLGPGGRPPLSVPVLDLLALVPRRLTGWADAVLRASGQDVLPTEGVRWGRALIAAVRVLRADDEVLRDSPVAYRYFGTLVYLHERMTQVLGEVERFIRLEVPCDICEQRVVPLFHDTTRKTVTCVGCGHIEPHASWVGRVIFFASSP